MVLVSRNTKFICFKKRGPNGPLFFAELILKGPEQLSLSLRQ